MAYAAILAPACGAIDRPIRPWKLDGFPGAPVEDLFLPLVPGTEWRFVDALAPDRAPLELRLVARDGALLLEGTTLEAAEIRRAGNFVEILRGGRVVDRPLALAGKVGDSWRIDGATATLFGYDRIEVLGRPRRALVVGTDRATPKGRERELLWFAEGIGWARLRTEREGRAVRDARLVAFTPGAPPD
jgi:hypothetical protein